MPRQAMAAQHYHVKSYQPRTSVGYLVKRTYALMLDVLEPAFAQHGFTYMQYVILMQLRSRAAINLRDICHEFRHDSGALTRVIDQLAERGLVERQRCAQDRRKVDLHLTAGRAQDLRAADPTGGRQAQSCGGRLQPRRTCRAGAAARQVHHRHAGRAHPARRADVTAAGTAADQRRGAGAAGPAAACCRPGRRPGRARSMRASSG